jgi:hypothetical protein
MLDQVDKDISLSGGPPISINRLQKVATVIGFSGLLILALAAFNVDFPNQTVWLTLSLVAIAGGISLFSYGAYANKSEGIKNDGVYFKSLSSKGF